MAASLAAVATLSSYNILVVPAALPEIGADLGRVTLLPWVAAVGQLSGAVTVLAVGPIIDAHGVRRVFRVAIVCMAATSAACAAAPSMASLLAARALQGFSAGALLVAVTASIGLVFESSLRSQAYALIASVWGLMGVGAPASAALLLSSLGWRAVLAVNIPVALAAAAVGWYRLPKPRTSVRTAGSPGTAVDRGTTGSREGPFDSRGLLIVGAGSAALLIASSDAGIRSLAFLGLGVLLALAYRWHARAAPCPVVRPSHILGSRWWPAHAVFAFVAVGTGANAFLPIYLRGARGATVAMAAFSVVWFGLGHATASWVCGRLQKHMSDRGALLAGIGVRVLGGVAATAMTARTIGTPWVLAAFFCMGCGVGVVGTLCFSLLQGRASAEEMGRVTAAHQFLRKLGFAYGTSIAGWLLFEAVENRTGAVETVAALLGGGDAVLGSTAAGALASAYTWTLGTMTAVAALALLPAAMLSDRSGRPI